MKPNIRKDLEKILEGLVCIARHKNSVCPRIPVTKEARTQALDAIIKVVEGAKIEELEELKQLGDSEMGGELTLKGHIDYRLTQLNPTMKHLYEKTGIDDDNESDEA